jgi:HEAT repeat protein
MRTLIKQTARLCLSQAGAVLTDAIERLGDTGDSRILHVLQEASSLVFDWDAKTALKKALGKVGSPKSEEEVETKRKLGDRHFKNTYTLEQDVDEYHERYSEWGGYEERCREDW